ncbi:MAG: hypothetical protein KQI35_00985 [Bacteroidetes bacterium]|nr:hypothetical protein [Bacteroidota bacterium]
MNLIYDALKAVGHTEVRSLEVCGVAIENYVFFRTRSTLRDIRLLADPSG